MTANGAGKTLDQVIEGSNPSSPAASSMPTWSAARWP